MPPKEKPAESVGQSSSTVTNPYDLDNRASEPYHSPVFDSSQSDTAQSVQSDKQEPSETAASPLYSSPSDPTKIPDPTLAYVNLIQPYLEQPTAIKPQRSTVSDLFYCNETLDSLPRIDISESAYGFDSNPSTDIMDSLPGYLNPYGMINSPPVSPQKVVPKSEAEPIVFNPNTEVPFLKAWLQKTSSPSESQLSVYADKLNSQSNRQYPSAEQKLTEEHLSGWFAEQRQSEQPVLPSVQTHPESAGLLWDPLLINDLQVHQQVNCPDLNPVQRPVIEMFMGLQTPHTRCLASDFLRGIPQQPVLVDCPSNQRTDEELVFVPSQLAGFPNRWKRSDLVVDYRTIRFSNWDTRWPSSRRLLVTPQERLSLKKVKICYKSLTAGETIRLLANLTTLVSLEDLEIDALTFDARARATIGFTFNSLKLLLIGSVKILPGPQWSTQDNQHLKITAPKLHWVFNRKWILIDNYNSILWFA